MNSIVFPAGSLKELFKKSALCDVEELAAMALAGSAETAGRRRLLVRSVEFMQGTDLLDVGLNKVVISPTVIARMLKRAKNERLKVVLIHSHPGSSATHFSEIDNANDRRLFPSLLGRAPGPHATVVLGDYSFDGAFYDDDMKRTSVDEVVEVGSNTLRLCRLGTAVAKPLSGRLDRTVRALGVAGQTTLRSLRIGVVGLGGTGSVVAQELAYLGVREFVLVDHDVVDLSNLNRTVTADSSSVGQMKTSAAAAMIMRIDPNATVVEVTGDVMNSSCARGLLECDFIFSCTDSHGSRAVLNQIAYQYFIPTIDVGVQITAQRDTSLSISGRVQYLALPFACLVCSQLLDPGQVRIDFMTDAQRRADAYVMGTVLPQPSVISLNATVASLAVTMFLSVVAELEFPARYLIYRADQASLRRTRIDPQAGCPVCSHMGALGRGDSFSLPWRADA